MKISFGTSVSLPANKLHDDFLDVVVTADVDPPDVGGRFFPPSDPAPEILRVEVDPLADTSGTSYERLDDVTDLIGEKEMLDLEDQAVREFNEQAIQAADDMTDADRDREDDTEYWKEREEYEKAR